MGTREVKLECVGEKSAVDSSDLVCSFIHNHLRPKSSGRVTHDSHKLQTKAINHSTRHYMNHRELDSDQPIHVPLLRVLSFPPPDGISALSPLARRRAPYLPTTRVRMDNASCNVLFMFCTATRILRRLVIVRTAIVSIKPFKRRPVCEAAQIAVRHEARTLCGGDELYRSWPYERPN